MRLGAQMMTVLALGSLLSFGPAFGQESSNAAPHLRRIKIATIGAPDVELVAAWYTRWLGFVLRERGAIAPEVASSWGTARMTGRPYILLSSESHPDVYIRAVQVADLENYRHSTTFGWNAFEIVLDDVYAMRERLRQSPFAVVGEPRPLDARPSIHAMQVLGPGRELLYLTTETGDRATSTLPVPGGDLGRLFILVLGGPDITAIRDFYAGRFGLTANPIRASRGQTVQRAWGGTDSGTHPLTLVRLGEHGNSMELNGYVKAGLGPRPREEGALPIGNAVGSFTVRDLDALDLEYISPPARLPGLAYGGARSATFIGPAGELTELIEENRPAEPR